jgi:hypothetical protein
MEEAEAAVLHVKLLFQYLRGGNEEVTKELGPKIRSPSFMITA